MRNKNVFLLGSVVLIVLAIALVAVIDRVRTPTGSSTDVRARAAQTKTLKMNGTVTAIDETKGTVTVADVYFADESRSGEPTNLGTWTVIPPATFSYGSVTTGTPVAIGVDAATFNITSHSLTAITLTPAAR